MLIQASQPVHFAGLRNCFGTKIAGTDITGTEDNPNSATNAFREVAKALHEGKYAPYHKKTVIELGDGSYLIDLYHNGLRELSIVPSRQGANIFSIYGRGHSLNSVMKPNSLVLILDEDLQARLLKVTDASESFSPDMFQVRAEQLAELPYREAEEIFNPKANQPHGRQSVLSRYG